MKKRILFVSSHTIPIANAGGGSIVIYRHLKRFQNDGYHVVLIHSNFLHTEETEFEEIYIKKKKWYPPLRKLAPLFTRVRVWMYLAFLNKKINIANSDIVISILGEYTNLLAVKIAKTYGIPLYMFYHDDHLFNPYGKINILSTGQVKYIIKHTTHFFAVSEPMKELLFANGAASVSLLYPMPNGDIKQSKKLTDINSNNLSVYHSGMLFEDLHTKLIKNTAQAVLKIQGRLNIIGGLSTSFVKELEITGNVNIMPRFDTVKNLFAHLIAHCDVLLVIYSFNLNDEHRLYHSFPSKFVEYCQLGIPIMIIAPEASAVGKWCIKNNWAAYENSGDQTNIAALFTKLKDIDFWLKCQRQCLEKSKGEFDPEKIHLAIQEKIFGPASLQGNS